MNRHIHPHYEIANTQRFMTIGSYLAERISQTGCKNFFTVPGDFILSLLDELLRHPRLEMIGCCNELNAGYAADGYCRETGGLGCCVVTYMVGSLSALNAIAGAYAENLPLLLVCGGPNNNDENQCHIIHHTIGEKDLYQSSKCFEPVVAGVYIIKHVEEAGKMIDDAITTCLSRRKPVYLEIACNISLSIVTKPTSKSSFIIKTPSDKVALAEATNDIMRMIDLSNKPVLIAGSKIKYVQEEFLLLANTIQCGICTLPDAKGLFPENHQLYMGTYWGAVSDKYVSEIVESADLYILVGPILNDYNTVGWSSLIDSEKQIIIDLDFTTIGKDCYYSNVFIEDLLLSLANSKKIPERDESIVRFNRYNVAEQYQSPIISANNDDLILSDVQNQIQNYLTSKSSIVVETGDSWFIGQQLILPEGAKYHVQMQYGSIGWSVGASLGIGVAAQNEREIVVLVGDGSFQMSVQELSTLIRNNINCTIFLFNNYGYTIEVEIHDNIYNDIQNWQYALLVDIFRDGNSNCISYRVQKHHDLIEAIKECQGRSGVKLIEICLRRSDCTSKLLQWGSHVSTANMRKTNRSSNDI